MMVTGTGGGDGDADKEIWEIGREEEEEKRENSRKHPTSLELRVQEEMRKIFLHCTFLQHTISSSNGLIQEQFVHVPTV